MLRCERRGIRLPLRGFCGPYFPSTWQAVLAMDTMVSILNQMPSTTTLPDNWNGIRTGC